jgi:hypothetical protein
LPDDLRIGAQERDAAVTLLSDHFVAGRLEIDEYQQRIDAALRRRRSTPSGSESQPSGPWR